MQISMTPAILIGEGILTWFRGERVSDRYGSIYLMRDGGNSLSPGDPEPFVNTPTEGECGQLVATVLQNRESTHIGDLFRGIFPSMPDIGEKITFGTGRVFYTKKDGITAIGLLPEGKRDSDWLDPKQLYRAHEQTVRLEFIEAEVKP